MTSAECLECGAHAANAATLMFNTGPICGEGIGSYRGDPAMWSVNRHSGVDLYARNDVPPLRLCPAVRRAGVISLDAGSSAWRTGTYIRHGQPQGHMHIWRDLRGDQNYRSLQGNAAF
jgi:hypothetical protein